MVRAFPFGKIRANGSYTSALRSLRSLRDTPSLFSILDSCLRRNDGYVFIRFKCALLCLRASVSPCLRVSV